MDTKYLHTFCIIVKWAIFPKAREQLIPYVDDVLSSMKMFLESHSFPDFPLNQSLTRKSWPKSLFLFLHPAASIF